MRKIVFLAVFFGALTVLGFGVVLAQDLPDLAPVLNLLPQPWGGLLEPLLAPLIGASWQPLVTSLTNVIKRMLKTEGVQTQLVALAISSTISLIASTIVAVYTGGFSLPLLVSGVFAAGTAWLKALTLHDTAKNAAVKAVQATLEPEVESPRVPDLVQ